MRRARVVVPAVGLLVAGALGACTSSSPSHTAQRTAAHDFLDAVGRGDVAGAAKLTDNPTIATTSLHASLTGLGTGARASFRVGDIDVKGSHARVEYSARWTVPGSAHAWTYDGEVSETRAGGHWRVTWSPTDLHPHLGKGEHLQAKVTEPTRAALLDDAGQPLLKPTPVVAVGIEPKLATDLNQLAATLANIPELQSTRAEIVAAVKHAQPTDFVPVITLRRPDYDRIKARIHDLPGTVFQTSTKLLGPSAHYAQPLLGTVGPATADIVRDSHGRITADQATGIGGLQQAYNSQLAGTPGVSIYAAPDSGSGTGRALAVVSQAQGGKPIKLSIDRRTQSAAEQALSKLDKPAALVVVQRSTGRILADANTSATTYDFGLSGAFPPGSTFKIATWTAAFLTDSSLGPKSTVSCPATTDVDGRHFINENRFSHPPISIADAFGYSCNTSAINAALHLPSTALADAARRLGLGAHWTLPVHAFSGSIPAPQTKTERAADAIGQGRVLPSPLLMALMASAADGGPVVAPTLNADARATSQAPLPATITRKMHDLMSATVDLPGGTGHALADVGKVVGKTGTAEYGNAKPPRSHAWFAGVHDDIAFAAFVYDGATDHIDAVPVVHDFLTAVR